jgi:hypothetical protein
MIYTNLIRARLRALVSHGYRSRDITQNPILLANTYRVPLSLNISDVSIFLAVLLRHAQTVDSKLLNLSCLRLIRVIIYNKSLMLGSGATIFKPFEARCPTPLDSCTNAQNEYP